MLKNAISLYLMILFSPAKINIGLQILEKREDGFHNIRSVMYPTRFCDILEIGKLPEGNSPLRFSQTGISIDSGHESNLVTKAWELLAGETEIPPAAIHLHKQIPVGAGLGGGSSNASITLKALNQMAGNRLTPERLEVLAARLGSDCPFFLHNGPMMMEGRGEILSQAEVNLDAGAMVQAVLNVMDNARKYALGGRRLRVESRVESPILHREKVTGVHPDLIDDRQPVFLLTGTQGLEDKKVDHSIETSIGNSGHDSPILAWVADDVCLSCLYQLLIYTSADTQVFPYICERSVSDYGVKRSGLS